MKDVSPIRLPFDIKVPFEFPINTEGWKPIKAPGWRNFHLVRKMEKHEMDNDLVGFFREKNVTVAPLLYLALPPNYSLPIHTDIEDFSADPESSFLRLNTVYSQSPSQVATWLPKIHEKRKNPSFNSPSYYRKEECTLKAVYECPVNFHQVVLFNPTIPHSVHTTEEWRTTCVYDLFYTYNNNTQRLTKKIAYDIFKNLLS